MKLLVTEETWPLREAFTISRGTKTEAQVLLVTIADGKYEGRGECVPYTRYGETIESVRSQLINVSQVIEEGLGRQELDTLLPAGAARNALDCAFWDLEAKRQHKTIWELIDTTQPRAMPTTYTIALDTPERMAQKAAA